MYTPSRFRIGLATIAMALFSTVSAQEGPGLGETPGADVIAAWDISVARDGSGLPPGSGSAVEGAPVYASKCSVCHGQRGEGGPNDRLVGGRGTIGGGVATKTVGSYWPYATTIFDYIRRAMPYSRPHSLSDEEAYALTAYLLYLNDIIDEDTVMNAATLPAVEMPNRDSFVSAYQAP